MFDPVELSPGGSLAKLFRDIPTGGRVGLSPPILSKAYKIVVKLLGDFQNYPQTHSCTSKVTSKYWDSTHISFKVGNI